MQSNTSFDSGIAILKKIRAGAKEWDRGDKGETIRPQVAIEEAEAILEALETSKRTILAIQAKVDAMILEFCPFENDCPSCDGTQLTINGAGEPDDCPDPCHRYGYPAADDGE